MPYSVFDRQWRTRMQFKFLGRIPADDKLHQVFQIHTEERGRPPRCVNIPCVGCVPQYAPTIYGGQSGFDPAGDCRGYFTLRKFQMHNNCYNYALDIASNSMAQPGRIHGIQRCGDFKTKLIIEGAILDGLQFLGDKNARLRDVLRKAAKWRGTLIALLMAPPEDVDTARFPGDFHWVRCDDLESSSWSHKPGTDQVSRLDFAGKPVTDPSRAAWHLNAGPLTSTPPGQRDFITAYKFKAWMFVPSKSVDII